MAMIYPQNQLFLEWKPGLGSIIASSEPKGSRQDIQDRRGWASVSSPEKYHPPDSDGLKCGLCTTISRKIGEFGRDSPFSDKPKWCFEIHEMGIFVGSNFETVTTCLSRNSHETRWIRNRPAKTTPFFRANAKRVTGCLLRDAHVLQGKVSQVDTQDTQNEGKEHHHTSQGGLWASSRLFRNKSCHSDL